MFLTHHIQDDEYEGYFIPKGGTLLHYTNTYTISLTLLTATTVIANVWFVSGFGYLYDMNYLVTNLMACVGL